MLLINCPAGVLLHLLFIDVISHIRKNFYLFKAVFMTPFKNRLAQLFKRFRIFIAIAQYMCFFACLKIERGNLDSGNYLYTGTFRQLYAFFKAVSAIVIGKGYMSESFPLSKHKDFIPCKTAVGNGGVNVEIGFHRTSFNQ